MTIVFPKMRFILLVGLALVAVGAAEYVKPEGYEGYHATIGIPKAAAIKAAEEEIMAGRAGERIVGGALAPANAYPYLAGMLISFVNIAGQSVCGSTLVTPNRLITAAHCWNDGFNQASLYEVILGSNFLFFGGTRIQTSQVFMHPQWDRPTFSNDIAVIYLPISVSYSASIQPATLPSGLQLFNQFVGTWAQAAGFGMTSDAQAGASSVMSHVSLQVITNTACAQVFSSLYVHSHTICTSGAGGVGICGGDSGGPLVVVNNGVHLLIGVSSFVAQNQCQGGFPSAYARITSFNSFLNQHLF